MPFVNSSPTIISSEASKGLPIALIDPPAQLPTIDAPTVRKHRLGGMLSSYHREAA